MLPKEAIFEYQAIYKKLYGKDLTFEEASQKALDFFQFFRTIYRPIKKEWLKNTRTKSRSKNKD